MWLKMWKERNNDRHGCDAKTRKEAQKKQAIHEIRLLYELQDSVLPQHRHIFNTPLETLIKKPFSQMQSWLTLWRPIIEKSSEQ